MYHCAPAVDILGPRLLCGTANRLTRGQQHYLHALPWISRTSCDEATGRTSGTNCEDPSKQIPAATHRLRQKRPNGLNPGASHAQYQKDDGAKYAPLIRNRATHVPRAIGA